jgi:hypothetical protein
MTISPNFPKQLGPFTAVTDDGRTIIPAAVAAQLDDGQYLALEQAIFALFPSTIILPVTLGDQQEED